MPNALKTPCRHPGCGKPCRGGYCDDHCSQSWRISDARRGTPADRGYDEAWRAVARQRRNLDAHLCQACLADNRVVAAMIVDHIVPVHVRPDWRLEIGNTQVLCHGCHQKKTASDNLTYGSAAVIAPNASQRVAREHVQTYTTPPRDRGDIICGRPEGQYQTRPHARVSANLGGGV